MFDIYIRLFAVNNWMTIIRDLTVKVFYMDFKHSHEISDSCIFNINFRQTGGLIQKKNSEGRNVRLRTVP